MKKIVPIFILCLCINSLFAQLHSSNTHIVEPKETFFSIARLYNIPPKELMSLNKNYAPAYSLKINDVVKLPSTAFKEETPTNHEMEVSNNIDSKSENSIETKKNTAITEYLESRKHIVQRGQTLFAISRLYEININDLKASNKEYAPTYELKLYDVVKVPVDKGELKAIEKTVTKQIEVLEKKEAVNAIVQKQTHKVEKGQTLYAISRLYNVSPKELMSMNEKYGPDFKLKENDLIQIIKTSTTNASPEIKKSYPSGHENNTENYLKVRVAKMHYAQDGQTMSSIASLYKMNISELEKNNPTLNPNQPLFEGVKVMLSLEKEEEILAKNNIADNSKPMLSSSTNTKLTKEALDNEISLDNTVKVKSENNKLSDTLIPLSYFKNENVAQKQNQSTTKKPYLKLVEHEVQKKETLLEIGNHYGVLITQIMELNKLSTVKLKTGQRLFINAEWIQPKNNLASL